MANNKIVYNNETLIDLTGDDVTAADVAQGKTFHLASGIQSTGTALTGLTILKYGISTWDDFIEAYENNSVVYCRASSNSNPASGSQTRLAFMAYVNNETTPTSVEFQYYRSVSSKSDSQQGDQVYVYTLTSTNGGTWSVQTRNTFTKVAAGTGLSGSWASGVLTLSAPDIATLDDAIGDLQDDLDTAAGKINDLQDDVGDLQDNLDTANGKIGDLQDLTEGLSHETWEFEVDDGQGGTMAIFKTILCATLEE